MSSESDLFKAGTFASRVAGVDVWLADVDPSLAPDIRERRKNLLDSEELDRWQRLRVQGARDQFLTAHALLRTVLSKYAAVASEDWRFGRNSYGRPFIAEPSPCRSIQFSISHTDGLVAVAVSSQHLGIDVENVTRMIDPLKLAKSSFSPTETSIISALEDDKRRDVFFDFWTLKEAYIKACGMGLALPLDSFSFTLDQGKPTIAFEDGSPDDPKRWRFDLSSPTATHRLAIATEAGPAQDHDIRVHWSCHF
jgi:4'-phosphopantetheinyl transferase